MLQDDLPKLCWSVNCWQLCSLAFPANILQRQNSETKSTGTIWAMAAPEFQIRAVTCGQGSCLPKNQGEQNLGPVTHGGDKVTGVPHPRKYISPSPTQTRPMPVGQGSLPNWPKFQHRCFFTYWHLSRGRPERNSKVHFFCITVLFVFWWVVNQLIRFFVNISFTSYSSLTGPCKLCKAMIWCGNVYTFVCFKWF